MDAESLQTFLAVHKLGSVSAAAAHLSRTQSAISRRIAVLEDTVGLALFERVGRKLVISEAGTVLLPHAERVAAAVADARTALVGTRAGASSIVEMAVVGTLADRKLSDVLARARRQSTGLDVRLTTATSAEVSARVRSGEASLGLRYFEDTSGELTSTLLFHEELVVACAPDHPMAGKRARSLAQLAQQRWLGFPQATDRRESFSAAVQAQFLTRGIDQLDWIAVDSLTAQKRLVEGGFGLALIQASAIAEERSAAQISVIRVDDLDARVPISVVTRKRGHLSAGAERILDGLQRNMKSRVRATTSRDARPP